MIRMRNFSIIRGTFKLDNISLDIEDGEVLAIVGKTGSGKTLLLESLAGLYISNEGSVEYDGISVWDIPLSKRKIGVVYQDKCLFPHMKVKDNIAFALKMHKIKKSEQKLIVKNILKELEIDDLEERWPETLSGGEKQRCAIGRALVLKPKVLFMDEPFSALDTQTKEKMYSLIKKIKAEYNCSIIFVTHDHKDAEVLADRVIHIEQGSIKENIKNKVKA